MSFITLKFCPKCGQDKPLSDFYRTPKHSHGRASRCIECHKVAMRGHYLQKRKDPEFRERTKKLSRAVNLRIAYGITVAKYDAMLQSQNGVCAICGKPETARFSNRVKNLAIDHCHKTGKIRALLCRSCNWGIGSFQDDIELLKKALAYLQSHITA